MGKRSDTKETVLVALELLKRIPRGRKVSATDLYQELKDTEFERDLRTVQRHLDMLSEHFPIERDDSSKPYGYRWKERSRGLSVPALGPYEALLLALAELHLKALLPASLMRSMAGFFDQAHGILAPYGNARLEREWLKKVRVISTTQPLLPPKIKPNVFETVSNALYLNHWLRLDYRNADGKQQQYRVMPLGLAQQGPRLYLACRFDGYDNERSLAMHRIHAAEDTGVEFERPKGFDLAKYEDDGRFAFGDGRRIRLSFRLNKGDAMHLAEAPLSEDQVVTNLGDECEVTATVVESVLLDRWLNSFGPSIRNIRRAKVTREGRTE